MLTRPTLPQRRLPVAPITPRIFLLRQKCKPQRCPSVTDIPVGTVSSPPVHCVFSLVVSGFQFRAKVALAELGIGNTEKGSYMIAQLLSRYPNYPEMLLAGAAVRAPQIRGRRLLRLFFFAMLYLPASDLKHFLTDNVSYIDQEDIGG